MAWLFHSKLIGGMISPRGPSFIPSCQGLGVPSFSPPKPLAGARRLQAFYRLPSTFPPSLPPPPFPLRRSSSVRVATGMRLIDLNPTPMKWFRLSTQKMKKELCRVQCSAPSGVTNYLKTLIAVSWGSFNDHVAPTLVGHFQLTFHQLIFSRNIHRAPHDIQIHENSFRKWTITSLL